MEDGRYDAMSSQHLQFMRDRRKEMRPPTRLQLLSVAGGLTALSPQNVVAALADLYAAQPVRWQAFMDDAQILIQAAAADASGFPETVQPEP